MQASSAAATATSATSSTSSAQFHHPDYSVPHAALPRHSYTNPRIMIQQQQHHHQQHMEEEAGKGLSIRMIFFLSATHVLHVNKTRAYRDIFRSFFFCLFVFCLFVFFVFCFFIYVCSVTSKYLNPKASFRDTVHLRTLL